MSKTATNLAVVLGLITIAYAGYYIYTQRLATTLDFTTNDQNLQNMLAQTSVFIQHAQTLNRIDLQMEFFTDPRLLSLQSFSTTIQEHPVGRPDPFASVNEQPQTF